MRLGIQKKTSLQHRERRAAAVKNPLLSLCEVVRREHPREESGTFVGKVIAQRKQQIGRERRSNDLHQAFDEVIASFERRWGATHATQ